MIDEDSLQERKAAILPHLDERQRRLFAAAEAKAVGYGGIAAVSRITRIAASTIGRGLKDLDAPTPPSPGRVRRLGGGRKSLVSMDPKLLEALSHYWKFDAGSFASLKSRRRDGFVPCLHRRGPEGSVRSC